MTELQLRILAILRTRGECSTAELRDALLPEQSLAITTVSTLLGRLVKRGLVSMRRDGRSFRYAALVTEGDIAAQAFQDVTELVASGNALTAISMFVDNTELSAAEWTELKSLIETKRAAARRRGKS